MNANDLKQLLTEEKAVSPVIGVILMVAITVILAAVIGTFVLGLGDQVSDSSPQASFSFEYTADDGSSPGQVEVSHDGGDSIRPSELTLRADENIEATSGGTANGDDTLTYGGSDGDGLDESGSDVTAGSTVTVYEPGGDTGDGNQEFDDMTLRVVWSSSGGDSTQTLAKWEGPDA